MSQYRLSKTKILNGRQCPKRLYLQTHHPELAVETKGMQALFAQGNKLGQLARDLHPGGILIGHDDNLSMALKETTDLLANSPAKTFFEATFQHGGVLVRADLLHRGKMGLHMVEVKSSTSVKPHYLEDCAVQSWVVAGAGYPLEQVELACVDNRFVYQGGDDYRDLLQYENLTKEIKPLMKEVSRWVNDFQTMLTGPVPDIEPGKQCKEPNECPFLGHCVPPTDGYPVDMLPNKGKLAETLKAQGIMDIRQVPTEMLRNERHRRMQRVLLTGKPELAPEAAEEITCLKYPRYYLDFETIGFVVPRWIGTRPYAQLPFQWSCHIEQSDGSLTHAEFLGVSGDSPMRDFAESLIKTVGMSGPVLVYNAGFEKGRMNELAELFPDLAKPLRSIIERVVDLLPITREHYYHPDMDGSWSIKAVLPTIAPDLDYANLGEVKDGGMAQTAYLEIIDPATDKERRNTLIADLRRYCERDTLAMVRLAHFLEQRAIS